jgi:hypothetical protein
LRDPALVVEDIEEDLISFETAREIYKVVIDDESLIVDEAATEKLRDTERASRLERGRPFDEFVETWTTEEPPPDLPYYGSWDDPAVIYGTHAGERIKMDADDITSMFMPNPKDVRIAQLEEELNAARAELKARGEH